MTSRPKRPGAQAGGWTGADERAPGAGGGGCTFDPPTTSPTPTPSRPGAPPPRHTQPFEKTGQIPNGSPTGPIDRTTYNRTRKQLLKMQAVELIGPLCHVCSRSYHPAVYEFHHLDEATKTTPKQPNQHLYDYGINDLRVLTELSKCVLVCANCHRLIHAGEVTLWR